MPPFATKDAIFYMRGISDEGRMYACCAVKVVIVFVISGFSESNHWLAAHKINPHNRLFIRAICFYFVMSFPWNAGCVIRLKTEMSFLK